MTGWIKLHRSLLDWEWYSDKNVFRLFIHLLLKANYEDRQFRGQTIPRGTLLTTWPELCEATDLSLQQARTAVSKLKSTGEITVKITGHQQAITVEKYDEYQSDDQNGNSSNNRIDNRSSTGHQQVNNRSVTASKEINNLNNINNLKNNNSDELLQKVSVESKSKNDLVKFIPPTIEEVRAYCQERSNNVNPQRFIDFYACKGWMVGKNKMKDWQAAVRTWEKEEIENTSSVKNFSWL